MGNNIDDLLERLEIGRKESIKRHGESYHEPDILCPYCGEEVEGEDYPREPEEFESIDCTSCGEEFEFEYVYVFNSRKK